MNKFREGEYFIYKNGDSYEIGKVKKVCEDGCFCYYHTGSTAAKTPFDCMHKLKNEYVLHDSIGLGGLQ
ncbi:MAG: hypothetical protein Q4E88_02900 [Coriobacteriia bacterium]|nr:hypothetical protein [Coriobacteriia bacterium]